MLTLTYSKKGGDPRWSKGSSPGCGSQGCQFEDFRLSYAGS